MSIYIAALAIAFPSTDMVNASLKLSLFPDILKIAKVIFLFQKGSPKALNKYKFILNIPVFSKLFKQAGSQLTNYALFGKNIHFRFSSKAKVQTRP